MSDINGSPNGDIKSKVVTEARPRVKVKHLTPAEVFLVASSLLVESVFKRDISLSSLVLCEMQAHNLVIKYLVF